MINQADFLQKIKSLAKPIIVRSPARINLIGEHVDYNEGLSLPAAIDSEIYFAAIPNAEKFQLISFDTNEEFSFTKNELTAGTSWVNYFMGVVDGFLDKKIDVPYLTIYFGGNIPIGAGVSSSAALSCGFAFLLNHVVGNPLDKRALAKIGQRTEHEFIGVKCGLMDQLANLFGQKNKALLVDFRSLEIAPVDAFADGYEWLLINTNVKHSLADSAYNKRRAACAEGVRLLQKKYPNVASLRDVSKEMLHEHHAILSADVFEKCMYVVEEIARVQKTVTDLQHQDMNSVGKSLYATHEGLRNAYEVSCDELDFIVDKAKENNDILGARMMGGGFGGCVIALMKKGTKEKFQQEITTSYQQKFNRAASFYSFQLSDGTSLLSV